MPNRDEIQAQIDELTKQLQTIAARVDERIDSGNHTGLTPAEESEIFQIEQRIKDLRKQL